jgi:hypothetical protein
MRSIAYVLAAFAVFGLAFWAYRENYATQRTLSETRQLQREIGAAQVRLSVLRAEWAYLNRPDRLRELADINFDRLGLLPLRPDQFGRVDEVSYPMVDLLPVMNAIELSAAAAEDPL